MVTWAGRTLIVMAAFLGASSTGCDGDESSDGDADVDGDGDTDTDADADSDTDADTDGDTDGDTDVDSDGDGDADGPPDGDTDGDSEPVGLCPGSEMTSETLVAAFAAAAAGATDIDLTPDACVRLVRTFEGDRIARQEVFFDSRRIVRWELTLTGATGERDVEGDGAVDVRTVVVHDEAGVVQSLVRTTDPGDSGSPTRRETYTRVDEETVHVVIEVASDGGALEVEDEFDVPDRQEAFVGPEPGERPGCTEAEAEQIQSLIQQAVYRGWTCIKDQGLTDIAAEIAANLLSRDVVIECDSLPGGGCAQVDILDSIFPSPTGDIGITVDPESFFDPGSPCSSHRLEVLWHEILHTAFGAHNPILDVGDPRIADIDQTYACAAMCFRSDATKCQCAGCLRTLACDPRCSGYASCDEEKAICLCLANPGFYDSLAECQVGCPSGLACFGMGCRTFDQGC